MGRWQQRERDLALDRQAHDPAFSVIPVLLPGADPALGLLSLNTWVDLRTGGLDVLAVLAAAVRGEPPGPEFQEQITATLVTVCPYRGLRPFREEDAPFFCGREDFTATMLAVVRQHSLIAVVGASGSGKSSVVRAGLIPALRHSRGGTVWEIATMVPGDRPLHALAAALLPLLEPDLGELERLEQITRLAGQFATGMVTLRDIVARALEKQPGTDRLLLLVDQWEELYTLCVEEPQRHHFLDLLLAASTVGPLTVVLTLRGDFYGHALSDRRLADRLQGATVNLGPLTRKELQDAIAKPATKVLLSFEEGLVGRILDDAGEEPGTLPLLEFVLTALWERRRAGTLHHAAYDAIGGLRGAIAERADAVYAALSEPEKAAAKQLLLQLVRPGEGTEDTRQRAELPGGNTTSLTVIRKLADARLVVTVRDITTNRNFAEVAHEALIREWQRLREWVDQNREFLRTRDRVQAAALLWEREGRQKDRLLTRGRPLAEAEDMLHTQRDHLAPRLIEFIEASITVDRARQEAERAAERRRLNRARLVACVMAILFAAASVLSYFVYDRSVREKEARQEAEHQRQRATAQSRAAQAALANLEAEHGSPVTAMRAALAALPASLEGTGPVYLSEAWNALFRSLGQVQEVRRFIGHEAPVFSAAISPDGRMLVTGSSDKTARVWEVATGQEIATLRGHESSVKSVAFSPDGRTVVTGSLDKTARVWEVATGQEIATLRGHEGAVWSVAFSPDGRTVVTGSQDKTARVWEVATGQEIVVLSGHQLSVWSVAFSPDGRTVATGSGDGNVGLWEVAARTGKPFISFPGESITSVAFSPDGRTLATTGLQDNTARLWDVATGQELATLRGHEGEVWSVAFSPNGRILVTGSRDATARLWEVASGKEIVTLRGHEGAVWSVAFSPDGRTVVTGSQDKTARVWEVTSGKEIATLRSHEGGWTDAVSSVAFSPDGRTIIITSEHQICLLEASSGKEIAELPGSPAALSPDGHTIVTITASVDNTVQLWEVATGKKIATLRGHGGAVRSVAFSPDGRILVTGSDDKTARLWEVVTGQELATLRGHGGAVRSVAFSPDGHTVVTAAEYPDNTARLWEVAMGQELASLSHQREVTSVAFSPDGRTVVTGSQDKTAQVWEVATGQELAVLRHEGAVMSVAFSPDGRTVVTGSGDKTARLWEVASGKETATFSGHGGAVRSVAFSPDGRTVVTGSDDKTVRLWEVATGQELATLRGHTLFALMLHNLSFAAISPDGRTAIIAWEENARLWDVTSGQELAVLGHEGNVTSVAFSPDGRTVVGSNDKTARLWEVATGQELASLPHQQTVTSVAFSPDGRTVVTGSSDNTARLWEVSLVQRAWLGVAVAPVTPEVADSLGLKKPEGALVAIVTEGSPAAKASVRQGDVVLGFNGTPVTTPEDLGRAVGDSDIDSKRMLTVWRDNHEVNLDVERMAHRVALASSREIATLRGHTGAVWSVAFSPDGRTVLTGSSDNTARLWEVATGQELASLPHQQTVTSVAFSPDGRTVATGSQDTNARLWDVEKGQELASLPHQQTVTSVAFSPDGRTLITGSNSSDPFSVVGEGGTARLWPVGQRLIDLACARVHELPLSDKDKQHFGIDDEWCTPEVSATLRGKLGLDKRETSFASGTAARYQGLVAGPGSQRCP